MELSHTYHSKRGEMQYHLSGEGPPIILIMGYLAKAYAWRIQVEALSPHYQVLCFDHYGVGDSKGKPALSMSTFAEDCLDLMQYVGWDKAHVIGVSMGGMIAQHIALHSPQSVASLTLIVTHAGGVTAIIPPLKGLPLFLRAQTAPSPSKRIEALMELLIPDEVRAQRSRRELLAGLSQDFIPKPPIATRLRHFWAIFRHNVRKRLSDIRCPTLIVKAGHDLLVNPKGSDTLYEGITHSELFYVEVAGHGMIRQKDTGLNDRILKHLSQV
jgi:pimeloyl-ACP methyl ester carboxylesterase